MSHRHCILSHGERSEPPSSLLSGLTDLSHPLAPAPLPHSSILKLSIIRPTFAFTTLVTLAVISDGIGGAVTASGGAGGGLGNCRNGVAEIREVVGGGLGNCRNGNCRKWCKWCKWHGQERGL
ncbi:Uncharacterized protein Fot_07109 [Forsythia ovata]|uniref:Uncharacterized protein n=1 Tax=Forsythia ovata TaxID=205694 RepID=A0ABD1WZ11_9LAMI